MKYYSIAALTISLLFLTGCITIIEKYTIHKDGSGSMEYIIDMSEMYEMMASFTDSTEENETMALDQSLREALPALTNTNGISNVELTGDISHYIAGIKFDFKDSESLNLALAVILQGEESSATPAQYIEIKGKNFTRFSLTSKEFNKEDLLDSQEFDAETTKSILESMKYKISVSFDKKVKKVTTLATYTKEDNTVEIEADFSDIFDNTDILKTTIKTK
jgi:hypothetical protein